MTLGTRLRFGVDDAPVVKTRMAYVGRADCGHIRIIVADTARSDFAEMAYSGLTLERIPLAEAVLGECEWCEPPEQVEIGL